jgi:uncharacterized membrane protein
VSYLAALLLLPLAHDVCRRRASVYGVACAGASATVLWTLNIDEMLVLKLLPVAIHLIFFVLFARSLRPGTVPIVTRIAKAMNRELDADEASYTRTVTAAWSGFFLLMAAMSAYLALYASDLVWSWFVNVISYALLATFFLVEFAIRRRVLAKRVDHGFLEFLLRLKQIDLRGLFW